MLELFSQRSDLAIKFLHRYREYFTPSVERELDAKTKPGQPLESKRSDFEAIQKSVSYSEAMEHDIGVRSRSTSRGSGGS